MIHWGFLILAAFGGAVLGFALCWLWILRIAEAYDGLMAGVDELVRRIRT